MTNHVPPPRTARPKPSAGLRLARVVYAVIPIATAAVVFLGSFI
ncbi:MAG: hypothetical protein ACXWEG_11850 [Actinomycetota bacterium]